MDRSQGCALGAGAHRNDDGGGHRLDGAAPPGVHAAPFSAASRQARRAGGTGSVEKKRAAVVADGRQRYPDRAVKVWAQDAARLGLTPVTRRVWTRRGRRPVTVHHPRSQWLDVSFFVHPARGNSTFLILPAVNRALMSLAVRTFQQEVDLEGRTILVLLLDHAGWQRAKDRCVPPGMALVRLPPSTPERSPAEPVVPLLQEAVANECFPRLEAVQARVVERCRYLRAHPTVVRGMAGCAWLTNT